MNTLKSNSRSFRYSDRVAEILDGFQGNSLNDKFNNLVLFCFEELPKKQKALKDIDKQIEHKKKEYIKLCDKLRGNNIELDSLIRMLEQLKINVTKASEAAERIAEE